MNTSAAQLSASGDVRWSAATAHLSSAPYNSFDSDTQLFKKCSSFSSPWHTVAVCLHPLHALT